jgi:SAM-dependent methyltransferase
MPVQDLRLIASYDEMTSIVAGYMAGHASGREMNILEAGCGRKWEFATLEVPYRLTGVDLDIDALNVRKNDQKDLDEAIVGDLRSVDLPENFFDVIYSSYVLEHIRNSEVVLKNFVKWLRPGGLLIIKIPDRDSVYGFVTRITPHWFHVLFYRYVKGKRLAGTPGHGPYPTFHDKLLSRQPLLNFADRNGLDVKEICGYHNDLSSSMRIFVTLIHILSFGKFHADHEDVMYIFQKR